MKKTLTLAVLALAALAPAVQATHRVAFRQNIVVRPYVAGFSSYGYGQAFAAPIYAPQALVAPVVTGGCTQQVVAPVVQGYTAPVVAPVAAAYSAPLVSGYGVGYGSAFSAGYGQAFTAGYGRFAVTQRAFVRQPVIVRGRQAIVVRRPVVAVRRAPILNLRIGRSAVRFR